MSFKPASMAFVCHLPALGVTEHFRSNLALSCSILFSNISIKELCQSGVVLSRLSFLRRSDSWRETFTLLICEASLTLGSEVKVVTHLIAVLDGSISHHRHLNKDVEIGEAFYNFLNSSFSSRARPLL